MAITSAIIVAGEAIISASVDGVQNYVFSVAKKEFQSVWYLKDEIKRTSELVETIRDGVEDAEKKQLQNEDVRKWIRDLKNSGYDMEDVLCDYRVVMASVEDGQGVVTRWMSLAKDALCLVCGIPLSCLDIIPFPLTPRVEIAHRLRSINRNLVEINQRKAKLSLDGGMVGEGNESDSTRSLGPSLWQYQERPMMGRSETKNKIKAELLSYAEASTKESCWKLFVIGIVGAGGMGKTTLAHNIFSDKDVAKAFSSRKWLYVGEKFDLKRLMNELLGENSQLVREDDLHSEMRVKFKDQSLLIVLDDAWHTNSKDWDLLQSSLSNGAKPHALIVTTRNKAVAWAIRHECRYLEEELTALPDTECMDIFKRWAFMGQQAEHYSDLEWLSEKVVEKLKGVPLAATMMGTYLNTCLGNRQKWVSIASDVKYWPDTDEGNVVDRVVGLSYLHLPPHLKPCFAYCAMFPKGFKFDKESLIRMWIAQGYVRPFGRELMEHTGSDYFDDLCQRSFFQLPNVEASSDDYRMHDLIHDFAKKVFTEGCQMDAGDTEEIRHTEDGTSFEEIRHLSFHCNGTEPLELKRLLSFKKLRTLMLKSDVPNIIGPLLDVLAKFKYLRLLVLVDYELTEFPDSIRHLKSLRYLDISSTGIRSLPELVCDLVNLQFLKLPHHCALPKGMNKLIKLRFIEADYGVVPPFEGIGQLTNLQGQRIIFQVQNKRGWKISELKGLKHLHGELFVCGLEHVKSKEEAEQTCLKDKVHLEELELHWGESAQQEPAVDSQQVQEYVRNDVESQVLEGLFPPPNLKVLKIHSIRGARFPSWMEEHPISSSLVTLELDGCCTNRECLPTLGRFPSLKELRIIKAHSVKKIGPEFYGEIDSKHGREINNNKGYSYFPRLEELHLEEMSLWEEWGMPTAGEIHSSGGGERHGLFPSLKKLYIYSCPKLLTLSPILRHLTNLKDFRVRECPKLASFSAMLRRLTALERLEIRGCDQLILDGGVAEDDAEDDQETISSVQQSVDFDRQVEEEHAMNDAEREAVDMGQSPSPYDLKDSLLTVRRAQLPSWMMERHRLLPSTLVTLELDGCFTNRECLPTLGQFPSLTKLTIKKADHVRKIGSEFYGGEADVVGGRVYFPRLEELNLGEMSVWEEWDVPTAGEIHSSGGGGRHVLFPSLKKLYIDRCPKLLTLSPILRHLTNLKEFTVLECPKLASFSAMLRRLTTLERLEIRGCVELILDGGVAEDDAEDDQEIISSVQQSVVVDSQVEEEHAMNDAEREAVDMGQSPSPYLKDSLLTVRRAQLPSWMMERHRLLPSTLVEIELDGCFTNRECLPTLGQLPSLTKLTIKKADHVRKIGSEFYGGEADVVGGRVYFPRLRWLNLKEMSVWEEWDVPAAGEMDGDGGGGTGGGRHGHVLLFPSLRMLYIDSCPKLPSLSPVLRHLTNLVYIVIRGCAELASLEEEGDGCGWVLPSLRELSIQECPKLASLTPILRRSTNLRIIEIKKCAELAWSEEEGDDERGWMLPSSLEELYIDDNSPKLPSLSQMLPHLTALRKLGIRGFRNLQCLPLSIHNLRSLQILCIEDCPAIECLSDGGLRLASSFRELWIRGCPLLEGRYREGGPDALNIPTTTRVDI